MSDFNTAREFAQYVKGLGFRAFVAGSPGGDGVRGYGFITDATGSRVLCFSMADGTLSGNYGPPSREAGTGWQTNWTIWRVRTADDIREALYSHPPDYCRKATRERGGWQYFTTLDQHLGQYGASSKYKEL